MDALYARLDADTAHYNAGLDSVARGETDAARNAIAAARTDLLDAASHCATTPPCDSARFVAAYDALLTRQASEMNNEGEGFAEVEDKPIATTDSSAGGSPVIQNLPAASRPVAMLKGRDLREIITLNEPMKAALTE